MIFGLGQRFRNLLIGAEYHLVRLAGRHLALDYVVRYLRSPTPRLVPRLLRAFGATIGERVTFKSLHIDNAEGSFRNLTIRDNCYVGEGVYFDLADRVTIMPDCSISGRVCFVTHGDCNRSDWLAERFPRRTGEIVVGRGSWVGFGATLLHGTQLGEYSMLAANALLRSGTPPRKVYAGVPAKAIREL